jgi:hypothetical protein
MSKSKKSSRTAAAPNDWETESDLHHLTKAAEIKADKARHGRAIAMARQKMKAMQDATAVSPTDPMADGS